MKELVSWLVKTEERAAKIYEKAMLRYSEDDALSAFVKHLAREEKEHALYMHKAEELISNRVEHESFLDLGNKTRSKLDNYFLLCEKRLDTGTLTKEMMIEFIINTEYSEWNNLFIYVVRYLSHTSKEFLPIVVSFQHHKDYIERFLETNVEYSRHLDTLKQLPDISQASLLIVDNDEAVADVIKAVLECEGNITYAANGEEGLKRISEIYFTAIIADLDLPVMNGIEFYNKAAKMIPGIKESFIFFTAGSNEEQTSLLRSIGLKYLLKPTQIKDIKAAVSKILNV